MIHLDCTTKFPPCRENRTPQGNADSHDGGEHRLLLAMWRSTRTVVEAHSSGAAGLWEWTRQTLYKQQACGSKSELTLSLGSLPTVSEGCMGVVIEWWWTAGMPVAGMWQPLPSWDALPQQCFPQYQVLGNPPTNLEKTAVANLQALPPQ